MKTRPIRAIPATRSPCGRLFLTCEASFGMLTQTSLAVAFVAALLALPQSKPAAADETAVRDLVTQYANGREKNDPAAVAALFTADADQLVSSGEWRRGRDVLVKGVLSSSQAGGK